MIFQFDDHYNLIHYIFSTGSDSQLETMFYFFLLLDISSLNFFESTLCMKLLTPLNLLALKQIKVEEAIPWRVHFVNLLNRDRKDFIILLYANIVYVV